MYAVIACYIWMSFYCLVRSLLSDLTFLGKSYLKISPGNCCFAGVNMLRLSYLFYQNSPI